MDSESHRQFPIVGILRAGQCGFVCLMLICCELAARGQDSKGSLRGSVQDASGGRLPGAKIVVQAKDFVGRREVLADKRGDFHIDGLMPGTYRVSASSKGFSETESDLTVMVALVRELIVTLKPEALRQTVNVKGGASSIM